MVVMYISVLKSVKVGKYGYSGVWKGCFRLVLVWCRWNSESIDRMYIRMVLNIDMVMMLVVSVWLLILMSLLLQMVVILIILLVRMVWCGVLKCGWMWVKYVGRQFLWVSVKIWCEQFRMMLWKDVISLNRFSYISMCSQLLLLLMISFMVCGSGLLMLVSLVQLFVLLVKSIILMVSIISVRMLVMQVMGMECLGFLVFLVVMVMFLMVRKNQIVNGIVVNMLGIVVMLKLLLLDQLFLVKLVSEKFGVIMFMNISSLKIVSSVMNNLKVVVICMLMMLSVMNMRYVFSVVSLGLILGNCIFRQVLMVRVMVGGVKMNLISVVVLVRQLLIGLKVCLLQVNGLFVWGIEVVSLVKLKMKVVYMVVMNSVVMVKFSVLVLVQLQFQLKYLLEIISLIVMVQSCRVDRMGLSVCFCFEEFVFIGFFFWCEGGIVVWWFL